MELKEAFSSMGYVVKQAEIDHLLKLQSRAMDWEEAAEASRLHAEACGCHKCWNEHEKMVNEQWYPRYLDFVCEQERLFGKHLDHEEEYLVWLALQNVKGGQDE